MWRTKKSVLACSRNLLIIGCVRSFSNHRMKAIESNGAHMQLLPPPPPPQSQLPPPPPPPPLISASSCRSRISFSKAVTVRILFGGNDSSSSSIAFLLLTSFLLIAAIHFYSPGSRGFRTSFSNHYFTSWGIGFEHQGQARVLCK